MRIVSILGSARHKGNTAAVVSELSEIIPLDIINLLDYKIEPYDYEHLNRDDDFLPLMRKLIANYDLFIFATPVYWYSMSGRMKIFLDRITDLITIEKELGRKLRGKSMAVINCSNGNNLEDNFWLPFQHTADYLGLHYLEHLATFEDQDNAASIKDFASKLKSHF